MSLKQMLENTEQMIFARLPERHRSELAISVKPRGIIGNEPGRWEVTVKFANRGYGVPTDMVLNFEGGYSLGALAMAAADFIERAMRPWPVN